MTYIYQEYPKWVRGPAGQEQVAEHAAHEAELLAAWTDPAADADPQETDEDSPQPTEPDLAEEI